MLERCNGAGQPVPQCGRLRLKLRGRSGIDHRNGSDSVDGNRLREHVVEVPPIAPESYDEQILTGKIKAHPGCATRNPLLNFLFG